MKTQSKVQKGICLLPVIPMRKSKSEKSEMINQILFGETFIILKHNKQWSYIQLTHDKYQGWICNKQYHSINIISKKNQISNKIFCTIKVNKITQPLLLGSLLPTSKTICNNLAIDYNLKFFELKNFNPWFIKMTKKYLNTPYLWGGRTPLGIDCSGYTQMIYRFFDIQLPRDAHQQSKKGKKIDSINNIKLGDLAFFGNKKKITHVGIILNNKKIIHSSGKVRIDTIKKKGIFNVKTQKQTHKLQFIKRILK